MKTVTNGTAVKLHYKGTLADGKVFDDSRTRGSTMDVLVGNNKLIPAFESALIGMTEGQTKTINLTAKEAYGERAKEAIITVSRAIFPDDFNFQEGLTVQGSGPSGQVAMATIVSFDDDKVILDHNHPLAGKELNFEIELVEIDEEETNSEE